MRRWGAVALAFVSLTSVGCRRFICSDEVLSAVPSPNGRYIARVVEVNCGATTSYVREVNIQLATKKLDATESVVFRVEQQPAINVEWEGESTLKIDCHGCARKNIFLQTTKYFDFNVDYDGIPR